MASKAKVLQIPVGQMANFSYIIADEETKEAVIIDPAWDLEEIFDALKENGWKAKYIINTHSHFDHVLGNEQCAQVTDAKIIQHENSELDKDITVKDGDIVKVGNVSLRIIHTPGHSKDSMCLIADDEFVITGDTLFVGNCGRTDLPGSDPKEMFHSLFDIVAKMDEKLTVYPGHNYGTTPTSTIGHEKKTNYVLQPRNKEQFLGFMASDD